MYVIKYGRRSCFINKNNKKRIQDKYNKLLISKQQSRNISQPGPSFFGQSRKYFKKNIVSWFVKKHGYIVNNVSWFVHLWETWLQPGQEIMFPGLSTFGKTRPVWNETFLCAGHVRQILVNVLLYSWLCAGHVRRTSLRFHTGDQSSHCRISIIQDEMPDVHSTAVVKYAKMDPMETYSTLELVS